MSTIKNKGHGAKSKGLKEKNSILNNSAVSVIRIRHPKTSISQGDAKVA